MATLVTSATSSTVSVLSATAVSVTVCGVFQVVVENVIVAGERVTAAVWPLVTVTVTLPVGGLSSVTV